jgi:hypothetical protein
MISMWKFSNRNQKTLRHLKNLRAYAVGESSIQIDMKDIITRYTTCEKSTQIIYPNMSKGGKTPN